MSEHPLSVFERFDPELLGSVKNGNEQIFASGALPKKVKLLIALALDASKGTAGGVRALTQQAMEAGATKEEIAETLRVANYISGVGCVYTAGEALRGLF
jgi:AhpD family alkylhydroperoxidase